MGIHPYRELPEYDRIRSVGRTCTALCSSLAIVVGSYCFVRYFDIDPFVSSERIVTSTSPEERSFPYGGLGAIAVGTGSLLALVRTRNRKIGHLDDKVEQT